MCYSNQCPYEKWPSGECNGKYLVCPMSGEEEETPDGDAIYELYKDGLITLKEARRRMR